MFRVIKINDITAGHFGSCALSIGVPPFAARNITVFAEGVPMVIANDIFNAHTNPLCANHDTRVDISTTSKNVFINNIPIARENGTLTCGDTILLSPINQVKTQIYTYI